MAHPLRERRRRRWRTQFTHACCCLHAERMCSLHPRRLPQACTRTCRPCNCLRHPRGHADTRSHYRYARVSAYWHATTHVHMPLCMRTHQVVGGWCYFPADQEKAVIEFVKRLSKVELSWFVKTKEGKWGDRPDGVLLVCGKQLLFPSKGHLELKW